MLLMLLWLSLTPVSAQQRLPATDFSLSDYRGHIVYLDFWASWCTPCRASFPFMAELIDQHGPDLAIVAINVDEHAEDAERFLQQVEAPFDIVFDPLGSLASRYAIQGMPSSLLFDRQGRLLATHVGFRERDRPTLQARIRHALTGSVDQPVNDR